VTAPAPLLQFRVAGTPTTRGSYAAVIRGSKPVLVESSNTNTRRWMAAVTAAAKVAMFEAGHPARLGGPLRVVLLVALPRPAAQKYPRPWHRNSGDVDKPARAALDAITNAGVWADDGLVMDLRIVKDYPGTKVAQTTPGIIVRIWHDTDDGLPTGQLELHP
jgi:Holliday junction resolvase RusA-like endonuclease